MARNYSLKTFLRQIPNDLLARFLHHQKLFSNIELADLAKMNSNDFFKLIKKLSDQEQNQLNTCCQGIFDMCCEKGTLAIIDTIRTQHASDNPELSEQLIQQLAELKSYYHKVMLIYLDYPQYWKDPTFLHHADILSC